MMPVRVTHPAILSPQCHPGSHMLLSPQPTYCKHGLSKPNATRNHTGSDGKPFNFPATCRHALFQETRTSLAVTKVLSRRFTENRDCSRRVRELHRCCHFSALGFSNETGEHTHAKQDIEHATRWMKKLSHVCARTGEHRRLRQGERIQRWEC